MAAAWIKWLVVGLTLIQLIQTTQGTWPGCITTGKDFMGDDVIKGLRFSSQECAIWCSVVSTRLFLILKPEPEVTLYYFQIGLRCVGWVYREIGTTCSLKAIWGDERTEADPLTDQDKEDLGIGGPTTTEAATTVRVCLVI